MVLENQLKHSIKKDYFLRLLQIVTLVFVLIFGGHLFSPNVAQAFSFSGWLLPTNWEGQSLVFETEAQDNKSRLHGQLPVSIDGEPKNVIKIPVTAYSSEVGQTDSTPFITASGTTVRRGVVAANFLPIGTKVRFPDLYGDEVFIVEDRMNQRYNKRIDIWMEETADARNFGLQWTTVEVF